VLVRKLRQQRRDVLAQRLQPGQLLDPLVLLVGQPRRREPELGELALLHLRAPVPRAQLVLGDPVEPGRRLAAAERAPVRDDLGERLRHQLGGSVSVERAPREVGDQLPRVGAIEASDVVGVEGHVSPRTGARPRNL
jgi:hypothetical protein